MSEEGEIPFLDADSLSEHKEKAVKEVDFLPGGLDPDERAIALIARKLAEKSSGQNPDKIEDMAIELYNRSCQLVLEDKNEKHLKQLAQLIEEDPLELQRRLREEDTQQEGGASALLRALSDD